MFIVTGQDKIYFASETGKIAAVNAMVIVQSPDQPKSLKTCKDLCIYFCHKATQLSNRHEEMN